MRRRSEVSEQDDDVEGRDYRSLRGAAIAAHKEWKPLATLTVANGFHTPRTFIVCVLKTFDFGLFLSCVCLINDDNEHHYIALVILLSVQRAGLARQ